MHKQACEICYEITQVASKGVAVGICPSCAEVVVDAMELCTHPIVDDDGRCNECNAKIMNSAERGYNA